MAQPLYFFSPIFDETAEVYVSNLLSFSPESDSETWLNTGGGSVYAGNAIIAALDARKKETGKNNNLYVVGQAASMGALMTPFYDYIKATDSANFLIHRASFFTEDQDDLDLLIRINAKIREKLEKTIDPEKFEKVVGVSFDEVFSMELRKDVNISANQALEIGLINEVVELQPNQIAAMANINFKPESMNLLERLSNRKPLITAVAGEQVLAFREIKEGSEIEAVGSKELFTGSFSHDNKEIEAKDGKITLVKDISAKDKEIVALNEKIATMEAASKTQETETFEAMAMLLDKVEALEGTITAAKMQKSNPVIPKKEFQEQDAAIPQMSARQKMKNKIAADNKGGNS